MDLDGAVGFAFLVGVFIVIWLIWPQKKPDSAKPPSAVESSPYVEKCFELIRFFEKLPPFQRNFYIAENSIGIWIHDDEFPIMVDLYLRSKQKGFPREDAEVRKRSFDKFMEQFLGGAENFAVYKSMGLDVKLYKPDDDDSACLFLPWHMPRDSKYTAHDYTKAIDDRYLREYGKRMKCLYFC